MRHLWLLIGIAASAAWLALVQRTGTLGTSPDVLAGLPSAPGWDVLHSAAQFLVLLPLVTAGIMAATLVVAWSRRRPPAASSAMKVLTVALLCAGAAVAAVTAREGFALVGLLLVASAVPSLVVFALRSRDRANWPPRLVALTVGLGVLGGTWCTTRAQQLRSRPAETRDELRKRELSRSFKQRPVTGCQLGWDDHYATKDY